MNCPGCHSENPPSAIFCDECGARLESRCVKCGEPNRHDAKFCRSCGQALGQRQTPVLPPSIVPAPVQYVPRHLADKIRASRHFLEGERKQVTVLFADIRGSTKLIEGLDPEASQKIIDPVLHIMMDAVHRYEGTVNQVLGDGIMAIFGAPVAHEDHALRACYASLGMQDEMHRYRQSLGQTDEAGLQIGVGMNTGDVVVRSIDNDLNMDYSALGQTTHLAARMQEIARGNGIILTAATLREVEGFVGVKPLGGVQVKGVSHLVEANELIGVTSAHTRVQASVARGLTPFVGRKSEIEAFQKLLVQAVAGRGQVLAMVGEPGVGKSRLVYEFTHSSLPVGLSVFEGESASYGKATPYFPLIALLRRYFAIDDRDDAETIQDRVVTRTLALDPVLKDTIPPVLSLLNVPFNEQHMASAFAESWRTQWPDIVASAKRYADMEPQQRRRNTLEMLKRIFIRESHRQPVLAIFEDLHWVDNETQAFLDNLVDSLPMSRILLTVNYRPGYTHGWADKTYYTQIRVDPLQVTSADELLNNLIGNNKYLVPLKKLLFQRTEGNPFFAEESVRSLVEAGFLVGEKGAYRPGLKIESINIPSTVQNVLADRIDALPIEEKHLLQIAAVIGVIVPLSMLRTVTELDEEILQRSLAHLQAAEFLYESKLFPEIEYTFKHALTNEVAYGALVHDRRTDMHRRVMRALEIKAPPLYYDHVEKLAHHAFYGEVWDKAVSYSKDVGDAAISRSSFRNAVLYYERALTALQHLPKSRDNRERGIDLRIEIRGMLFVFNDFKRGFEYLEEALDEATALDDHERIAKVLICMTAHCNFEGNSGQAVITGKKALNYAAGLRNADSKIVAHNWLGVAYHNLGQFKLSTEELNEALSLIPEARKTEFFGTNGIVSVNCKAWLIRSLAQIGNFSETLRYGEEAIQTATERDYPLSIVFAYYAVGAVALIQGEFDLAIAALEHGLKVCEAADIPVQRPLVVSGLSAAYAFVGRCDEALGLLESTADRSVWVAGAGNQQARLGRAMGIVWEVETYMLSGRHSEAETLARRVLALFVESKHRGSEAWLHCLLGDLSAHLYPADLTQAETSYRAALSLAQDLDMRPLQAHCYLGLGQIHAQASDVRQARSELHAAGELYRIMCMPFWLARVDHALAAIN